VFRPNLLVAEATVPEVGHLDQGEALELTALISLRDRERGRRYALRWLQRWLEEAKTPTIEDAAMVASCLAALGGALSARRDEPAVRRAFSSDGTLSRFNDEDDRIALADAQQVEEPERA
jgi:hypothetical protein